MLRAKAGLRYVGIFLVALLTFIWFNFAFPAKGQSVLGCEPGYVELYPGVNSTCIPSPIDMTLGQVLEGTLPYNTIRDIYLSYEINRPIPPSGGKLGDVLPLVVIGHNPSASSQLNTLGIQATLKEIISRAGRNPASITLNDIPFFKNYLPQQKFKDFIEDAYETSSNPFGNKLVGQVEPIKNWIINRIGGLDNYNKSGIAFVPLNKIREYAQGIGNGNPIQIQALKILNSALNNPVGNELLNAGINSATNGLGLENLLPGAFRFSPQTILGDLFGLDIPLSKIKSYLDMPVPVVVRLHNTGTGNILPTTQSGNLVLNIISGFICPTNEQESRVADTSQGRRVGHDSRISFAGNPSVYFRIAGFDTECKDTSAKGVLGAISNFKGRQVINAWTMETGMAKITFQLGVKISVEGINYEGRMQMCFTKKPWSTMLGCSANGALPGGLKLPPIRLNGYGVVYIPISNLLQSFLTSPQLQLNSQQLTTFLAYMLQFMEPNQLTSYIQRLNPQLIPLVSEAQKLKLNSQGTIGIPRS